MDKAIIKQIKKLNKKIKERFPNTFRGITPSFYAHQSSPLAEKNGLGKVRTTRVTVRCVRPGIIGLANPSSSAWIPFGHGQSQDSHF